MTNIAKAPWYRFAIRLLLLALLSCAFSSALSSCGGNDLNFAGNVLLTPTVLPATPTPTP